MVIEKNSLTEELDTNSRFETKYRLLYAEYFAIKNALVPYLKPDLYTLSAPSKKYLVRSLYFDTRDYRMYTEKIDGECDRIKFRIRTYGSDPDKQPDIRVEMKVRKGNTMEKYGSFISYHHYRRFIETKDWDHYDDPTLVEFKRYLHTWNLRPTTLVQYEREGFHSREPQNFRLTFDHQMISSPAKDLFPDFIFWHRPDQRFVIMEIKHQNELPHWFHRFIKNYNLKVTPNSKYANSMQMLPELIASYIPLSS